jgi:hypothetical protein
MVQRHTNSATKTAQTDYRELAIVSPQTLEKTERRKRRKTHNGSLDNTSNKRIKVFCYIVFLNDVTSSSYQKLNTIAGVEN